MRRQGWGGGGRPGAHNRRAASYHGLVADPRSAPLVASLHRALQGSGVDTEPLEAHGDGRESLVLAGTDMRLSAAIGALSREPSRGPAAAAPGAAGFRARVDARFQIGSGRVVLEACTGEGDTEDAAVAAAVGLFVDGPLPVLLSALLPAGRRPLAAPVEPEPWSSGSTTFRAFCRGIGGGAPAALRAELRAAVASASLSVRTHWVSVRGLRSASDALEVYLDGAPWPAGLARLSRLARPSGASQDDGSEVERADGLFVLLDAGFDTSRAVAALHRLRDRPDPEIARALVAQGASAALAEKLVDFVPLAFGRPILERMGVRASEHGVLVEGESERTFRLLDDPLFADAVALAREAYAGVTMPGDVFQSIAMRGAELAAVSDALASGASTRNLALSPPRFTTAASMS